MAKIIVEGIWAEEGKIGITAEKREELGEIGYIELPEVGAEVAVGDKVCEVETIKEVVDILAPIAGKIVAVNADLDDPSALNEDPDNTWICEIA
ncbi:MAG: glycine cleavage system protein H [Clostridia bacterium]|nr:glycine cleavage system protein H [Clostridia bacterium]